MGCRKTFVVDYCANQDGGSQELNTARNAILSVHPEAQVIARRYDTFPIHVKVTDLRGSVLWQADQTNLFRKNPCARAKSVREIKSAVASV